MIFQVVCLLSVLASVLAECPNACSNNGKCGAFDMCTCYKNWMANDCSQRVCQFNHAHVDSPKGDLDSSGSSLSGPGTTVVVNDIVYPYGTTEQYPNMVDSDGNVLSNTAHDYMECSNKGLCDRNTGTCVCFSGYTGSACQRASCPSTSSGVCSGAGTCETIETLAALDGGNIYNLWDKHATMGCKCDPGYTGPDCSQKVCKYGSDPLYHDDYATVRYANFTYEIYLKSSTDYIYGNYSLAFTDRKGKTWFTSPIDIAASCDAVTNALETLPNNVIASNSVLCYQHTTNTNANVPIYDNTYMFVGGANSVRPKFTLVFTSNPGKIKQIGINKYLDGERPTLYSSESVSTLKWHIYANGFTGDDVDLVPDLCEGVLVTLLSSGTTAHTHSLGGLTTATAKLLKTCLGDSDGDLTNNVDVNNWDWGNASPTVTVAGVSRTNSYANPHLIKLVDATQDLNDNDDPDDNIVYPVTQLCSSEDSYLNSLYPQGWCFNINSPGFYAVLYYDGTNFNLFTRAAHDFSSTTQFHVFTTTGYLQRVSPTVAAFSYTTTASATAADYYHSNTLYLMNTSNVNAYADQQYYGSIDCVNTPSGTNGVVDCVDKDDYLLFLNVGVTAAGLSANPVYPNLYQVQKIGIDPKLVNYESQIFRHEIVLDYGMNSYYSTTVPSAVYKFHPPTKEYKYVQECAGRGLCDSTSGICNCFTGYTGDDCSVINALAK